MREFSAVFPIENTPSEPVTICFALCFCSSASTAKKRTSLIMECNEHPHLEPEGKMGNHLHI